MRAIAVLRPEPGNAATVARIVAAGGRALALPLFVVSPVAWTPPDPAQFDNLLLTSANALRHGGRGLAVLTALPVHAVGAATADAARAAGFTVVATGTRGVEALAPPGRVLQLAGREHRGWPGATTVIVYASDALHPDLTPLIGGIALIHSPRAAHTLAERMPDRSATAIVAISPAAADAASTGWQSVTVAAVPTDAAIVAAALALAD